MFRKNFTVKYGISPITTKTSESNTDEELSNNLSRIISRNRGFEIVSDQHRKNLNIQIQLPTRGSAYSAGYDFYSPIEKKIYPNKTELIWTDIKAYMQNGEVLFIDVRSSVGIKKGLMLANTIGVIDSDYYQNVSNDGNIGICLHNYSNEIVHIDVGERIAQGVFLPFLVSDNGNTANERLGGIGST